MGALVWADAAAVEAAAATVSTPLSPFQPYIAQGTVFTRRVNGTEHNPQSQLTAMPLASNSAAIAANMIPFSESSNPFGVRTSLNTGNFNIPVYMVNTGLSTQRYITMTSTDGRIVNRPTLAANTLGRIPWPAWATPAPGGDRAIALYDVHTGMMRESFMTERVDASTWSCRSSGYFQSQQKFAGLSADNFWMQMTLGSNSVVGMFNTLSQIGIAEALAGVINHALSFTIPNARWGYSFPARQGDGTASSGALPYQGQWFRINPSIDLGRVPLRPFTRMVARACQTYGGFAADRNLFCNAFNAEPSNAYVQATGQDPWRTTIPAKFGSNFSDLNDFPWQLTQWAPKDWGVGVLAPALAPRRNAIRPRLSLNRR